MCAVAPFGHPAMSALRSLSGEKWTCRRHAKIDANDPERTSRRPPHTPSRHGLRHYDNRPQSGRCNPGSAMCRRWRGSV